MRKRGGASSSRKIRSPPTCGTTPQRVIIYVLVLVVIAVIAYIMYRILAPVYRRTQMRRRMEQQQRRMQVGSGLPGLPGMPGGIGSGTLAAFEGYEDAVAADEGDEYEAGAAKPSKEMPKPGENGSLVYLHMDGCGYCRRFDPTWASLKENHGAQLEAMGVAVESHEAQDAEAAKYDAVSYPTILFARNGTRVALFDGKRTEDELMAFVKKHAA